jgi:hypothetical protein
MARYDVDVRIKPGQHVRRRVRARSGHAAYERVAREHVESGGEWSMELAVVTRKGLRRRRSTVLTGSARGGGEDGGLAGVREPRRPKPTPPSLRQAREG